MSVLAAPGTGSWLPLGAAARDKAWTLGAGCPLARPADLPEIGAARFAARGPVRSLAASSSWVANDE
jgi:hypothetical protein